MKFLLDVNASGALRELLVTLGYDVACVSDIDSRMSDSNILHWAVRESRIIITTDSDFEQIIWQQERLHNGVLRLENLPRNQRIELFKEILANYSQYLESGAVIIANERKIRIRQPISNNEL
jgi:predicted nuclease of predicted toxin-antitoxin system